MGIQNIKKHLIIMVVSLLILFCTIIAAVPVAAAPQSGAGFSVRANIPENQIDSRISYFDLHMQPRQIQTLSVEITNEFDTPITIRVEAISASTNRNGIIDYKTPNIKDETLLIPFSDIAVVEETNITLPANSVKSAIVRVTMPDNLFDGVILGGLVFTREIDDKDTHSQTTSINNEFSYVIGVKLSETETIVVPQFEIVEIVPEAVNYQATFLHMIRNTQAAIVKNLNVEVSILSKKNTVQATASMNNVDMAPNSVMPFVVTPNDGNLKPGEYLSNIRLEYEGQSFDYQVPFTITADEANHINNESITENVPNNNLYFILLSIILALIVIILTVLLIRKRKKEDD